MPTFFNASSGCAFLSGVSQSRKRIRQHDLNGPVCRQTYLRQHSSPGALGREEKVTAGGDRWGFRAESCTREAPPGRGQTSPGGGVMDQLIERCSGLDVHRDTIAACVRVPGPNGKRQHEVRTFGTTAVDGSLRNPLPFHQSEVPSLSLEQAHGTRLLDHHLNR